ncbi:MAG: hypothetical protein AB7N76_10310 [Planctomycetota bacterium]
MVRLQPVRVGEAARPLLLAVFPLQRGPGAVGLQLQDDGDLRRGGVYWLAQDAPTFEARAPRFDELFADLAAKLGRAPALRPAVLDLLGRAHALAGRCLPPGPDELGELGALAAEADALDPGDLPGAFPLEGVVLCLLLIFVSEEERYPRPRYKGARVLWERLREVVG